MREAYPAAMTDKSAFSDSEWHALTDAPLLITAAVFIPGEHGPISMVKEASASAKSISKPGERGVANALIGQIVAEANTKEARGRIEGASRTDAASRGRRRVARARARCGRIEETPRRRSGTSLGVVPRHRASGRAVGQVGQPRRTSDDRQARDALRHNVSLSPTNRVPSSRPALHDHRAPSSRPAGLRDRLREALGNLSR